MSGIARSRNARRGRGEPLLKGLQRAFQIGELLLRLLHARLGLPHGLCQACDLLLR